MDNSTVKSGLDVAEIIGDKRGGSLLVALEKLLGRRVDVVSEDDLHPLIRPYVLKEARPL